MQHSLLTGISGPGSASWKNAWHRLTLVLSLLLAVGTNAWAGSGIFEGYAILNLGGANTFYDLNGTGASTQSTATANPDFNGGILGTFAPSATLLLKGGQLKTFKNGGCNVTNATLFYTVYLTASRPASPVFTALNLPFDADLASAGDQQWTGQAASVNLLAGLPAGAYTVEVSGASDFNSCGTGTNTYTNAGGTASNYRATFTVSAGPLFGTYTIDNLNANGTSFTSFTAAFTYANTNGVSAATTFNAVAGRTYIELPPLLTATGTVSNTITFQKSGSGANPIVTATTNGGAAALDYIIGLSGSDFVTFDGIDVSDAGSAAGTAIQQREFGYALFRASATDGCQNNTIRNCVVTLNRANVNTVGIWGANHAATVATVIAATSAAGANSGNKINGNTVTNTYTGIYFFGSTVASGFLDVGNEIGTTAGNTVSNIGSGAAATTVHGIRGENQNNLKVENNTITIPANYTGTGTLQGISLGSSATTGLTGTLLVNNNTISIASASTGTVTGIRQASTSGLTSCTITNNKVQNCALTGATGTVTFIDDAYNLTTGTSTITGNQIIGNSVASTGVVTGIFRSGSGGTVNLSTNYVGVTSGGAVSANTMTGATGIFYGIRATTGTITLNGNFIRNNSFTNTSGVSSVTLYGYYNFGSPVSETLTGNTITDLSIVGASTGTGHTMAGIYTNTTSTAVKAINGNTIGVLTLGTAGGTMGGTINGINQFLGTTVSVSQNKIYGLVANSTSGFVNGIALNSGTTTNAANNLIGDLRAPASLGLAAIAGLTVTGGTTVNAYFNTINLAAISSGATFGTSGIYLNSTTTTLDLRNNIVVNNSGVAGTGGFTAALRRNSGTAATVPANYATTSNNNLFYAGTPSATNLIYVEGTTLATNAQQTLTAYKAFMVNRDQASVTENPPFLTTTGGGATFLHLSTALATQAESGGAAISGITTDYDGDTRNASTPDIGADEGTFVPSDLTGPTIAVTTLGNTSSTANRTLTATISDVSGISTTTPPRVFYRKGTTGAFVSAVGTAVGSTYSFVIDHAAVGGVIGADVIQYYVVAQDVPANVSSSPSGGTFSVAPGSVFQYVILPQLNGVYYISANAATSPVPARTYPTITAALTNAANAALPGYNNAGLGGAVTFLLLDATYSASETFPLNILANPEASATNTLTIKPSNATGTTAFAITGTTGATAGVGLLQLLGSDYVTIDGSLGNTISGSDPRPSRDLTVTNTSTTTTSSVIQQFSQFTNDGATFNTIKNLVAVGTATATVTGTQIGVQLSGSSNATAANQYTNNTVQNVAVRGAQVGIASIGGTIALKNQNVTITQNDLNATGTQALTRGGILAIFDNGGQYTLNNIGGITSGADDFGISLGFPLNGLANTTFTGSEVTNATVSRNNIGTVVNTGTFASVGIAVATATTGTNTVANNFVSGVLGNGTGGDFAAGIYVNGATGGGATRVLFNSVSMTGTATGGGSPNFALAIGGTTPTVEIRNNVFYNSQTVAGAASYAIGLAYTSTTGAYVGLTSTNNAFAGVAGIGLTGSLGGGTARIALTDLNTETGQDRPTTATAPVGTSLTLTGSPFVSTTDLHTASATLNAAAVPVAGFTTDFDGQARDASTPDIGADEFTPATFDVLPTALLAPAAGQTCFGSAEPVTVTIKNNAAAALNFVTTNATVTVSVTGAATQTFTATLNSGTLAAGATQNVTVGSLNMTALGTYNFAVTATVAGDANTANDVLTPAPTRTNAAPQAALPYAEPFNSATLPTNFTTAGFFTSTSANNGGATGSYGLRFNIYSGATSASATTPILGTTVSANNVLTFDARFTNFSGSVPATVLQAGDKLDVQVAICGGAFATVFTINNTNQNGTGTASTSFFTYSVPLTGVAAGQKIQVRLLASYGGTSGSDFYVDLDNLNVQSLVNTDLAATALVAPTATQGCYTAAETVTVTVRNQGSALLDFATNPATVTVNVSGATTATLTATLTSGTLAAGASQNVTVAPTLNMTSVGTYTFGITATVTGDQNTANDLLAPSPTRTVAAPVAGVLSPASSTLCNSGTATLTLTGAANGTIQYQSSPDNLTFTDVAPGGTAASYTTPVLTQTTYYRAQTRCAGNPTATSNVATVTVNTPAITSTNAPQTICAGTTATVTANGSSGTTVAIFAAATGGTALATGTTGAATASYTTPALAASTTYYAEASTSGTEAVGKPASTQTDGGFSGAGVGLVFTATGPVVIQSTTVFNATATAGSVSVELRDNAGALISTAGPFAIGAGSTTSLIPTVLALNLAVPAAGTYRLVAATTPTPPTLYRDFSSNSFPYTSPSGTVSVTGGYINGSSTVYYFFYNLQVSTKCIGAAARTALPVNVNPRPTFGTAQTNVTCNGAGDGTITVTAAGGTGSYEYSINNGGAYQAGNVFAGLAPATYAVLVRNLGGTQCAATASQAVTISQPAVLVASATPTNATCANGADGSISASATGGTTAYQFNLNGGAYQGTGSFTGLAPGSYTIGVKDANNCTASTTATVGSTNPAATANAGTAPAAVCAGNTYATTGSYGGSATSATYTSSGTGTFSNGGVINGTTTSVTYTPSAADIAAGSVVLTLTTAGPCATATATLPLTINSTTTWTGTAGTNWFDAGNWSACVPTTQTNAVVPTGLANYPDLTTAGTATALNLTIQGTAVVSISNAAAILDVKGNLTTASSSSVTATAGTVSFTGATAQGIGAGSFFDLVLVGAASKTLTGDLTIANSLDLTNGLLTLGSNKATLTGTATVVGFSATHFVVSNGTGTLCYATVGVGAGATRTTAFFPIGSTATSYTPSTLTNTGAVDTFCGTVQTGVTNVPTGAGTGYLNKQWDFTEATAGGSNASLTLQWNATDEGAGFNRNLVDIVHYTGGAWRPTGFTAYSPATGSNPYSLTRSGYTSFSPFTVQDGSKPLPVSLTRFEAVRQEADALLSWATASEKNNAGFEVQLSTDGRTFRTLHTVEPASANSFAPRTYTYTDREAGKTGLRYYRLRQLDFDGTATTSGVRTVAFGQAAAAGLSAAPNPFVGTLTLTVTNPAAATEARLTLTDAAGRTVLTQGLALPAGTSPVALTGLDKLPTGVYLLHLPLGGRTLHLKVVKE